MEDFKKEFFEGHPVHYIQCQCSTAHTFGNVTAFIQNWLLNLFPKDLFRTIHVNSKISHSQMRSTPKEFLKKAPPMFIIRPKIDWTDTSKFLNGTMLIERQGDLYSKYAGTNLQDFFMDRGRKVAIKYQMNRHVMNFDVVLIFQTMIQQINWANYFRNAVRQEIPFFLQTCLESYISPKLLEQLSKIVGIPMYDENGSNREFLKYLNSNSAFPITYKLQGSTNSDEYYRYYPVNIDTIITNFSPDEGSQVGQISERYSISFNVRCEFYSTGFYYLFSDALVNPTVITIDNSNDSNIIPIFTDVLTKDDIDLPMGWQLYASPSCRLETKNDSVSIDSLLSNSIKAAIKFHTDRGITLMDFFRIRVRKQGKLLEYGKDYTINFDDYTLQFHNCDVYYTYKILIMINVDYVNNLVKDIYKLK
jgi:hypothetical protein